MAGLIGMSARPRFPPELIDAIFSLLRVSSVDDIEHVDEGLATLRRCAMDPVLGQFAEPHFFSNITVRNSPAVLGHAPCPGAFSATWWAKRFTEQPHVARYVRHVTIVLDIFQNLKPCFEDILSRVTRLESIALSSGGGMMSLSGSFRTAFLACIRSPHMKTVCVASQFFSPSMLNDCNIRNLIFRDVSLHFDPQLTLDDARADTPSHPVLDSLSLFAAYI
jgi:hypothetical protein